MKNTSIGFKITTAILCLVTVGYFCLQGYRYFTDPLTTSPAYTYQVEQSVTVTGWVVREEQVLQAPDTGILQLSRAEGERVSKGGQVAMVYDNQAAMDRQEEIRDLTDRIEQLKYAKESAMNSEAVLRLDNQIINGILELRGAVTARRLDTADASLSELRTFVLKRDYSYSGGEDLDAQLKLLEGQLKTLQGQAITTRKQVRSPAGGLYSAVVDGYESVLTPQKAADMLPEDLDRIVRDETVSSRVGRLITGDTWYYLFSAPVESLGKMTEGQKVSLRFASSGTEVLEMRVQSIRTDENGRAAVLLSSKENQASNTLLRLQSADVIWNTIEGIRVPAAAIRVDQEGRTGIYCIVGMNARFKPVEVVYTGGDGYTLVRGLSENEKTRLRPGDSVIVTAFGLYDGKVVG